MRLSLLVVFGVTSTSTIKRISFFYVFLMLSLRSFCSGSDSDKYLVSVLYFIYVLSFYDFVVFTILFFSFVCISINFFRHKTHFLT